MTTNTPTAIKPPLGCAPRRAFEQRLNDMYRNRAEEVWAAIRRYIQANEMPPVEWVEEFEAAFKYLIDAGETL